MAPLSLITDRQCGCTLGPSQFKVNRSYKSTKTVSEFVTSQSVCNVVFFRQNKSKVAIVLWPFFLMV